MPRGLEVSRSQVANMISFVNLHNFLGEKKIYIMTFGIAHWDTFDDSLAFSSARRRYFWAYQSWVSCVNILVSKTKILLSILHASVICVQFPQLVDHCVTSACTCNTIEHAQPNILISALESQVSRGDNYDEVVNRQGNLSICIKIV